MSLLRKRDEFAYGKCYTYRFTVSCVIRRVRPTNSKYDCLCNLKLGVANHNDTKYLITHNLPVGQS